MCASPPNLIVVEATGGYEEALVLADYGKHIQPLLFVGKRLSALMGRRKQLNQILQAEKNRLRTQSGTVRSSLEWTIACLEAELQQVEKGIRTLLQEHADLQTREKFLRTAKSMGPVTAAALLADLPELGKLDRQENATLVRVAPINADAGRIRGYRKTKGGRPAVRCALYMAILTGISYNPILKPQDDQLVKRGKQKKVAITACMRKMLTILNAMMRDRQPFRYPAAA
jgi:transposase